mmetsp:Transcript_4252/g.7116  ORF Transcript_4252/g.7116 Transcript_4252/m.7116 type:complete len:93 (+) Transcript_4252:847-1125(+)
MTVGGSGGATSMAPRTARVTRKPVPGAGFKAVAQPHLIFFRFFCLKDKQPQLAGQCGQAKTGERWEAILGQAGQQASKKDGQGGRQSNKHTQ